MAFWGTAEAVNRPMQSLPATEHEATRTSRARRWSGAGLSLRRAVLQHGVGGKIALIPKLNGKRPDQHRAVLCVLRCMSRKVALDR